MDLTTKERVRVVLGQRSNPAPDELVEILIDAVSAKVEAALDRYTLRTQRTEYFDIPSGARSVMLRGYPVTSLLRVWVDSGRDFGITDSTVSTTVNDTSAAGGTSLKVASTTGFALADVIAINQGGDRDEEHIIAAIPSATEITTTTALTYAHTLAQADEVIVSPTGDAEDSGDYTLDGTASGLLYLDWTFSAGPKALKVTYTGGMATTTATFMTAYPDLSHAVAEQVAYDYRMRDAIGTRGREGKGSASKAFSDNMDWALEYGDLVPNLVAAIRRYQNRSIL